MKLPAFQIVIISLLFAEVSAADDNTTRKENEKHYIKAELKGILDRAPGGNIEWYPLLRVNKIHWQLGLPVKSLDDVRKPDPTWYKLVGKTVVVTGTLDIRPNIRQKSGERRTEYHVNVKTVRVAKEKRPNIRK